MKSAEEDKDGPGISRREFSRVVGLAAATVALPASAAAKTPAVESKRPVALPITANPFPAAGEDAALTPIAEAQVQIIFARYGNRLNDEQKADVRRLVAEAQKGSEALQAFHLENSDEPAMIYTARLTEE